VGLGWYWVSQGGLTERRNSFGVEFFPGRVSPVGWAAFPAGKGITEQGLKGANQLYPLILGVLGGPARAWLHP
jgi:hypothetical protein